MFKPATLPPDGSAATPARLNFIQRLESLAIRPAARSHYVRWAEAWIKARGHRSAHTVAGADALANVLADVAQPGDMVVCLGAGDITKWAGGLAEKIKFLRAGG